MNSPSENETRQRENVSTLESESNVLEASTVRCFPAVKRTFRQKQSNWRWRWKYFTRALQPISEQGENTKDDSHKVDDNDCNSSVDYNNEKNIRGEKEHLDQNNQHLGDCTYDLDDANDSNIKMGSLKSKEDYSACNKLIEKFQEAVLDNAVRVIQAAFKRFRERRRFLKLKKAATVIQRIVRQWLQLRHSDGKPKLQSAKPECKLQIGVEKSSSSTDQPDREVNCSQIDSKEKVEERESMEESCEGERDACWWNCSELIHGNDGLHVPESPSNETDQFDNSYESLDTVSLTGSADNLSETEVYIDQSDGILPTSDPDALSLADSGIDMCSDTMQEIAVVDDCEYSKIEITYPKSSRTLPEETSSHQK